MEARRAAAEENRAVEQLKLATRLVRDFAKEVQFCDEACRILRDMCAVQRLTRLVFALNDAASGLSRASGARSWKTPTDTSPHHWHFKLKTFKPMPARQNVTNEERKMM